MRLRAWSPRLTSREQRVATIGSAAIVFLLVTMQGIPRWLAWVGESRLAAVELVTERAAARVTLKRAARVEEALMEAVARADSARVLLVPGSGAAGAGGNLAGMVSLAARSSGVTLGTVQISADSGTPALGRVRVRADGRTDVRGLTSMLLALERGPAALRIAELVITQADPGATDDTPEVLRMELVVVGLYLRSPRTIEEDDA